MVPHPYVFFRHNTRYPLQVLLTACTRHCCRYCGLSAAIGGKGRVPYLFYIPPGGNLATHYLIYARKLRVRIVLSLYDTAVYLALIFHCMVNITAYIFLIAYDDERTRY